MDLKLIEERTSPELIQALIADMAENERIDKIEIVEEYKNHCIVRVLTSFPSSYLVDKRIPRISDWQCSRHSGRVRMLHSINIGTMQAMLEWAEK